MKHKRNWLAISGLLCAVSFAAGYALASRNDKVYQDANETSAIVQDGIVDTRPNAPISAPRERPQRSSPKPRELRVSIPIKSVIEILQKGQFSYGDFEKMERLMNEALTLLGATEGEREKIFGLLGRTKWELYAAERQNLKAIVSDVGVTFEMESMYSAAATIVERMQQDMRTVLPSDLAEALITSINWQRFYYNSSSALKAPELRIVLRSDGLVTSITSPGDTRFARVSGYPDDGSAIPAAEVFPERWVPFLSGVSLVPVIEEE